MLRRLLHEFTSLHEFSRCISSVAYFEPAKRREGDLAAAAETLKTVLKGDPRADWAYNELIELLYAMGRHADAQTLARTALRVNPLNAQAHNLFGTILSQLNDLPAGEWHFRRALEARRRAGAVPRQPGAQPDAAGPHRRSRDLLRARADALAPGDFRHAGALVEAARGARRPSPRAWRTAGACQLRALARQRRRPAARQSPLAHGQGPRSAGDSRRRARHSTAMRGSNAVACSIGSAATTKRGATWSKASGCWPPRPAD